MWCVVWQCWSFIHQIKLVVISNYALSRVWGYRNWPPALLASVVGGGTVYPKIYAHGFVVLCFVVVMQSFIMNSHVFIHIHQGCFAGTGAIVRLPQCQWSEPDGYGKISQCITTTKHSKAKTVCIFLGIYCTYQSARAPSLCAADYCRICPTQKCKWHPKPRTRKRAESVQEY